MGKRIQVKPSGLQRYKCLGFGHYAYECTNRKKEKGKDIQATWKILMIQH